MIPRIALASDEQRNAIYGLRHEVYAREIGQHSENPLAGLVCARDEHER